ncbi:hypothetical protein [Mycobacterium sp. UM_CSW]|uniref:hypothetical protein n=1 Tax=Mycobacterium sp. UM_CSW TaxID=1370119 RepID=UPI000425CA0A|nr:hypothetical protein [Mycobacterium sp. UM_CSW]
MVWVDGVDAEKTPAGWRWRWQSPWAVVHYGPTFHRTKKAAVAEGVRWLKKQVR